MIRYMIHFPLGDETQSGPKLILTLIHSSFLENVTVTAAGTKSPNRITQSRISLARIAYIERERFFSRTFLACQQHLNQPAHLRIAAFICTSKSRHHRVSRRCEVQPARLVRIHQRSFGLDFVRHIPAGIVWGGASSQKCTKSVRACSFSSEAASHYCGLVTYVQYTTGTTFRLPPHYKIHSRAHVCKTRPSMKCVFWLLRRKNT